MDPKRKKLKVPSELSLIAYLSAGLTIVFSVTYIVLCSLAIYFRFQCNSGLANGGTGDKFFIRTLYRVYIQAASCENPQSSPPAGVLLMDSETVFLFIIIILVASVLTCATAIILIVVIAVKKRGLIFAFAWIYVCTCFLSVVVDAIFGIFFGIDYSDMAFAMENNFPGIETSYRDDVLRLGSLFFMSISLKGFLFPVVNSILLIILAIFATKYWHNSQTDEHSIHKVGVLNAYEHRINHGFVPEESRRSPRSPTHTLPVTPLSEYPSSRNYDRSNSWQHSPAPLPFSYMEEPRRPRASPGPAEPWRRDPWPPAPPVPAPDYSPPARRLKSALKPNYM